MNQTKIPRLTAGRGSAFALIALALLVVAILVSAFVVNFSNNLCGSDETQAKMMLSSLKSYLMIYSVDTEAIPSNQQGLAPLVSRPVGSRQAQQWRGPYIEGGLLPVDPWGHAYAYHVSRIDEESREVTLRSLGSDGKEDTTDDIILRFTTKMIIDDEGQPMYAFLSDQHGC